ncbi:MAG: hypothetical protein WBE14_29045, partial [Xanthobacteraceae bacterium]
RAKSASNRCALSASSQTMKRDFMNVPHADTPTYERSNTSDVRQERHYFGRHSTRWTERRIIGVMSDEWDGDVYVVAATKGKQIEYWAVAVPRHRALAEVQSLLQSGWRASLSRRQLTRQMITDLKMRNGSVRQLKFEP